ncbi:heterokaryon incompatibility protein-domain-containing protein [Xylariaceae sp. FL0662B]|nr:heterokaryon incompatibility protein-domain-containing protein [Xylariaceae sp. FL0662B]
MFQDKVVIWMSGKPFLGMPTVADDLRALRRGKLESCMLWIDSICINQEDIQEKFSQVQLMPSIFSRASKAAVCLGEADAEDAWALKILASVNLAMTDCSEEGAGSVWDILASNSSRDPFRSISGLFDLSRHRWWSRIWTVREYILAQSIVFLYGNHHLPHDVLELLFTQPKAVADFIETAMSPTSLIPDRSHLFQSRGWILASDRFCLRNIHFQRKTRFTSLLFGTRFSRATHPLDRFYSLLELMPSDFPLNYNEQVGVVRIHFCAYAITLERNLDLFSILTRDEDDGDSGYCPSWASQFSPGDLHVYPLPLLADEIMGCAESTFEALAGKRPPNSNRHTSFTWKVSLWT